jgi:Uma2 family endonuclease
MSTMLAKPRFTPDDMLRLSGGERYELVAGQLVRTEMSALAALVALRIGRWLANTVEPQQLGIVMTSDASYRCFPDDPDRIRRPDVSFIRRARMRREYLEGHVPIPPDLAVEVVSPNNTFFEVRQKVNEYLHAKVPLVWVVNPDLREVEVYRANGTYQLVAGGEDLDGEEVIPGFRCPLREIFQPVPMEGSES